MFKKSLVFSGILSLVLVSMPSCSSSPAAACQGGESCACYPNDTCNAGLSCRSKTCVNLDAPGTSSGGTSGSGIDTTACLACAQTNCASDAAACKASSGCTDLVNCILDCNTDATCLANCGTGASTDTGTKAVAYESCAITQCISDCVYVPSGAGGSSNPGTGGSATSGGGDVGTGNGGAGQSTGGAGSGTAGATGTPPSTPTSGVNWLTLVADGAPPDQGVNGALGVDGVLYAYGDGCATMTWEPSSRCVVGNLCLASATSWGVAIGFDFYNSGATWVPPNTKHAWSATAAGATGLAWQDTGQLPSGLQVWVQNMDPSFNGSCSATSCDINGPADGASAAPLDGQFSFATMQKDNWGGTGISYVFSPTDISALQFKIPGALDSEETQYQLCVDAIGVVR
jgi:hypothetical protein